MTLSRLFVAGERIHFHRNELLRQTRRISSSSSSKTTKSPQSKKGGAAKEQRVLAVESFVKNFMEMHPGVFPKASQVQNEVGGSWYLLKGILTELREKMSNNRQIQMEITSESLDATVDMTSSEAIKASEKLYTTELDEPKSRSQPSEGGTGPHNQETNLATNTASNVTAEKYSGVLARSEDSLHCAKIFDIGDGCQQSKANSSTFLAPGKDQEATSEPLSFLLGRLVSKEKASTELGRADSNEVTSIENGVHPQHKVPTFRAPNDSSKAKNMSSSEGSNEKFLGLADMYLRRKMDGRETENDTLSHDTSSDLAMEASGDNSMKKQGIMSLVHRLMSKEKPSIELGRVDSDEVPSIENGVHPPQKVPTFVAPSDSSKAKSMSSSEGSNEEVLGLADTHVSRKMEVREAGDDTLTHETASDLANEASGDCSMKKQDVMSLLDRIKKMPDKISQTRSADYIISNRTDQLKNGCPPTQRKPVGDSLGTSKLSNTHKQQKPLHERFTSNKHEEPKKTNFFTSVLKHMNKGSLTKMDDCTTHDGNNPLNKNEDPTEKVPFEIFNSQLQGDNESGNSSDDAAFDYVKSEPSTQNPLSYKKAPENRDHKEEQNPLSCKKAPQKIDPNPFLFTVKGGDQTTLLVRFLQKQVNATEIGAAFGNCGPIAGIRLIPSSMESSFKDAYINFKTKEGLQKALAKTDVVIGGGDVIIEAACPSTKMSNRILAPNLVGDPDVPTALLENPTRSVMVKGLPHDIASHHLREAFTFCGGHISGFYMGPSSSVAFIEFETEDAKEKAIAASFVSISGRKISILRIDAPRTTVVRISNVKLGTGETDIHTICSLHGKVKRVLCRDATIFDVHFKLFEWRNMVNILNRLNGKVVNEHQWIAQPATVIPVEILRYLWNDPEGRMHVHSVIRNLSQKLEENLSDVAKLNHIAAQYYDVRRA